MKKRSIRVSLEKDGNQTPNEALRLDRNEVVYWNAVIRSNVEALGKGLIVLYAAKKAIDTASILIIKSAG